MSEANFATRYTMYEFNYKSLSRACAGRKRRPGFASGPQNWIPLFSYRLIKCLVHLCCHAIFSNALFVFLRSKMYISLESFNLSSTVYLWNHFSVSDDNGVPELRLISNNSSETRIPLKHRFSSLRNLTWHFRQNLIISICTLKGSRRVFEESLSIFLLALFTASSRPPSAMHKVSRIEAFSFDDDAEGCSLDGARSVDACRWSIFFPPFSTSCVDLFSLPLLVLAALPPSDTPAEDAAACDVTWWHYVW